MSKRIESAGRAPVAPLGDWVSPYTAENGPLGALLSRLNHPTPQALEEAGSDVQGVLQAVRSLLDFVAAARLECPDLVGEGSEVMALNGLASDLTGVCIDALASIQAAGRDVSMEEE